MKTSIDYIIEKSIDSTDPKADFLDFAKETPYNEWEGSTARFKGMTPDKFRQKEFAQGKVIWFRTAADAIEFVEAHFSRYKKYFGDEDNARTVIAAAYEYVDTNKPTSQLTYMDVPFIFRLADNASLIGVRSSFSKFIGTLNSMKHGKTPFQVHDGMGGRHISGEGFEHLLKKDLRSMLLGLSVKSYQFVVDGLLTHPDIKELFDKIRNDIKDEAKGEAIVKRYIVMDGKKQSKRRVWEGDNISLGDVDTKLKRSGKDISDITIVDPEDTSKEIYLSLKKTKAQTSGIQNKELFNPNNKRVFDEFCEIMGIEDKKRTPQGIRNEKQDLWNSIHSEYNSNIRPIDLTQKGAKYITDLIRLIVGANYYYVRDDGKIFYIPDDKKINVQLGQLQFGKPRLGNKNVRSIYITCEANGIPFQITIRTSDRNDPYPCRFFLDCEDLQAIFGE